MGSWPWLFTYSFRSPTQIHPKNDDDDLNPRLLLVCFVESLNQFFDSLESHRSSHTESQEVVLAERQQWEPPRICSEISLNGPLQIYDWSLCICKFLLPGNGNVFDILGELGETNIKK